ncbi:MAG TPA: DUF2851 family protein [Bacteroidia bacterium]|nr:DUF2851 family protein [Bacteroidia bacterium]HRS58218.1 DUF2851 family protein [Bacteroidia bacterium]HRU68661.1 DUF2851 family protein [Bacteroidia bacterium]
MKEELLQFVWKYQLFEKRSMQTTEDEPIEVVFPGIHNQDAGPDFLEAKIRIGDKLWAGNVEIHLKSSDWNRHGHQHDPAYQNIILHVVYEDDEPNVFLTIPKFLLKYRIPDHLKRNYQALMISAEKIPCHEMISSVDRMTIYSWLQRMTAERFEVRNDYIINLLNKTSDWHESFYVAVARSFGYRVNADAFEKLALLTPQKLIARHKNNLLQVEALLFGQAGMLDENFSDDYPNRLKAEYQFLQAKYQLKGMKKSEWKFARLRPADFPTIRIAQFSMLLHKVSSLFSAIIEANKDKDLKDFFHTEVSSYWLNHYQFDHQSESKKRKRLGISTINRIVINAVIPFLFSYGKQKDESLLTSKAFQLLENLPAEKNSILGYWEAIGLKNDHAADSQALLHLKKHYCDQKKCLSCSIGTTLMQRA